uniref:Neurogenic mastermind-like N-terminal domain-containing protein n=1 Tax=Oryzias latipes TaxID=8090 RepID=A0A3P9L264_ORYLA
MGEATPAQSTTGTFVPMLGLGAMPTGVTNGPVVAPSRGPVGPPPLHNAIVERLRARIELCRRHHSNCENRYQRGQAESSDREHESTLHLLNIVHQGPGTRKTKGSRASNQQPPEYSRAIGDQKSAEGEQRISTRIALQGSLRRKIEGNAPGQAPKQNGLSCGFSGSDFKRIRMDAGVLEHVTCSPNLTQSHPLQRSAGGGMHRKNYMMPPGLGSDIINMTLKGMKTEPVEAQSCSQSIFEFKDEGCGQIDPELQDLFDELTKSVPPLNDFELEKMLKQDDTFGLDLGRPSSAGAAASLCSPMEKQIKTENSPDFGPSHCGSPQHRPASAGPSFTLTSTSSTNSLQKTNNQAGHPRTLPCWPEISHAQQLKQMAANQQQQQPSSLLHHHHQTPNVGMSSWAPAMNSSSSTFPQGKTSTSATLSQQRVDPHNKEISNCLFKSNGHGGAHQLDMKCPSTKPTLHFSPKTTHSANQPVMSIMTSPASKPEQQSPSPSPNQPHAGLHFQGQQISTPGSLCLQPKSGPAGLPFRLSQPQQGVPTGPNGNLGVLTAQSQLRHTAANNQQKGPAKNQTVPRQLSQQQQQHSIGSADKDNACDQFSRHLTRPPPDYKQSRGLVGVQPGSIFTGQSSSQPPGENSLQSLSCHLRNVSTAKMGEPMAADCPPSSCVNQFQHSIHNRVGLNQSRPRFLGPNPPGKSFRMNSAAGVQHQRATADLHSSGGAGQGLMTNATIGWGSANKQVTAGLGLRCLPTPQGVQDMPNHPYPQRHVGPPNQVAPDLGMLPLNPLVRETAPRSHPAIMSSPSPVGNLSQVSPEQRVPAGNFQESSPSSNGYQSSRPNRLTFDFLPEGDNTVPGINADSDFIDALLKSGSGNDDWMKDINLDEILGGHS